MLRKSPSWGNIYLDEAIVLHLRPKRSTEFVWVRSSHKRCNALYFLFSEVTATPPVWFHLWCVESSPLRKLEKREGLCRGMEKQGRGFPWRPDRPPVLICWWPGRAGSGRAGSGRRWTNATTARGSPWGTRLPALFHPGKFFISSLKNNKQALHTQHHLSMAPTQPLFSLLEHISVSFLEHQMKSLAYI